MNLSGYILVCDYHIGEEEFQQALDAVEKAKEDADNKLSDEIKKAVDDKALSDEIEKAAAEKDAKNKAEVDDWADSAFSSITNKREKLIQHSYSIYESYLALYRIKNEADNKQSSNNTQTKITTPNEDDFAIASNRFGQIGKTLKTAFLYGPSASVKSKGKIYVEIDGVADQDEVADDEKRLSDEIEKAAKDSKKNKNNESTIYHDYSIFEAYSLLNTQSKNKIKNEADEDDDSNKSSTMADTDLFVSGATFIIKVVLENEGYSEWKVFINSNVPSKQYSIIKNALKSGEFKKAYEIAGQYTDTDGLVPMSCKTYITKKPECGIPWLGHCRYGFAPGSEDDDPEIANTLFLAIAPFNAAKGGKPDAKGSSDEAIVFKTAYNVTGDISDGKVGSLVNFVKNQVSRQADRLADERPDDYEDIDDELTKYLKDRFKCIGDSSMYKQFLQIREYLSVELKEKEQGATTSNLQIDFDESTNIKSYANQVKSKKALIFY